MISFHFSRQQLLISTGLLLVVGFSWWLQEGIDESVEALYPVDGQPDYHMKGLSLQVLGEGGVLQYHLSASRMAYFFQDESAHLQFPQIVVYRDESAVWMVKADQGVLYNSDQLLSLDNGVSLYKGNDQQVSPLQLHTEQMQVDLKKELALSEGEVQLQQPPLAELTGRGMQLDLQQNQLHLLSQVRVRYENK